jgi:hypothetical protein
LGSFVKATTLPCFPCLNFERFSVFCYCSGTGTQQHYQGTCRKTQYETIHLITLLLGIRPPVTLSFLYSQDFRSLRFFIPPYILNIRVHRLNSKMKVEVPFWDAKRANSTVCRMPASYLGAAKKYERIRPISSPITRLTWLLTSELNVSWIPNVVAAPECGLYTIATGPNTSTA